MSSNNKRLLVFSGLAVLLLIIGFLAAPSVNIIVSGLKTILTHPSLIDFDGFYFAKNFGSSFVNAGIDLSIVLLITWIFKAKINGSVISSYMMIVGFSFYGKNFINMWFPMIGVALHLILSKQKLSEKVSLVFFSTALSPIFSVVAFGTENLESGSMSAITIGIICSIAAGFLTSIFAQHLPKFHRGILLYNTGFAAGLAATFINILLVAVGLGHDKYPYGDAYITDKNTFLSVILIIIFSYFIIAGIASGGLEKFKTLFWYRGEKQDHPEKFGFGASLINMGVIGIIMTIYVVFIAKGAINGTTYACILTACGFAAAGSTFRTHLPAMLGVFLGAFITGGLMGLSVGEPFFTSAMAKIATRGIIMSVLFTCGIAPLTYHHGALASFCVGVVHSMLSSHICPLHGWMSLYNNGFSLGLLISFMYPIYSRFPKREPIKKVKTSKEKALRGYT